MTDLLGTTPRTDGSIQVTYAGHPLYYYAHEGKNEVTCHDVDEFGGFAAGCHPRRTSGGLSDGEVLAPVITAVR